jgi:hypothetical protein
MGGTSMICPGTLGPRMFRPYTIRPRTVHPHFFNSPSVSSLKEPGCSKRPFPLPNHGLVGRLP